MTFPFALRMTTKTPSAGPLRERNHDVKMRFEFDILMSIVSLDNTLLLG